MKTSWMIFLLFFLFSCKPEISTPLDPVTKDDPTVKRYQKVEGVAWTATERRIGQTACHALKYRREKYEFEIDGLKNFEFSRKLKECGDESRDLAPMTASLRVPGGQHVYFEALGNGPFVEQIISDRNGLASGFCPSVGGRNIIVHGGYRYILNFAQKQNRIQMQLDRYSSSSTGWYRSRIENFFIDVTNDADKYGKVVEQNVYTICQNFSEYNEFTQSLSN